MSVNLKKQIKELTEELDKIYTIIGRVTVYRFSTPPSELGLADTLRTHLHRATQIEAILIDEGYRFDWYKGWTLDMVTTPLT